MSTWKASLYSFLFLLTSSLQLISSHLSTTSRWLIILTTVIWTFLALPSPQWALHSGLEYFVCMPKVIKVYASPEWALCMSVPAAVCLNCSWVLMPLPQLLALSVPSGQPVYLTDYQWWGAPFRSLMHSELFWEPCSWASTEQWAVKDMRQWEVNRE